MGKIPKPIGHVQNDKLLLIQQLREYAGQTTPKTNDDRKKHFTCLTKAASELERLYLKTHELTANEDASDRPQRSYEQICRERLRALRSHYPHGRYDK